MMDIQAQKNGGRLMVKADCRISKYTKALFTQVPHVEIEERDVLRWAFPKCPGKRKTLELPLALVEQIPRLTKLMELDYKEFHPALASIPDPKPYPAIPGPTGEFDLSIHISPDQYINRCIHLCMYYHLHIGEKTRYSKIVDVDGLRPGCKSIYTYMCDAIYQEMNK